MTKRTWAGVEYLYFNDAEAAYDNGDAELERPARAPQPGVLLAGCPACGIDLKKPRPLRYDPAGKPSCIMTKG